MNNQTILIPTVEKYANVGSNQPFLARIWGGLSEIVSNLDLTDKEKELLNNLIGDMVTDLIQASQSLEEIKNIESGKKEKVISELEKQYKDLYDYCWRAYKDKMQKIVLFLGFNLSFLFKNEKEFIKNIKKFKLENPAVNKDFDLMLINDRKTWQNKLATFRNDFIQHKKLDYKEQNKFFNIQAAETIFSNCWQAMEDILVNIFILKLNKNFRIVEIPSEKRDKAYPKRFKVTFNQEIEKNFQEFINQKK